MKIIFAALAMLALFVSPTFAESVETEAKTVIHSELKDGTRLDMEGNQVFVVSTDGNRTPAPDGTHVLKDGSAVVVKNGKKVSR